MARVPMTCMCGWGFFISDSESGTSVNCPSCRQPVPIPGRGTAKVITRHGSGGASGGGMNKTPLLIMGAIAAVLVIVIIVLVSGGNRRTPPPVVAADPEPREVEPSPRKPSSPRAANRNIVEGDPDVEPSTPPSRETIPAPVVTPERTEPAPRTPQIDHQKLLLENMAASNMAGIVSTALRIRHMTQARTALQMKMVGYEEAVGTHYAEIIKTNPNFTIPLHMLPGDEVAVFDGKVLDKLKPDDAVKVIESYLRTFQPGKMIKVEILRGQDQKPLFIIFPMLSKEMKEIARTLGIDLGLGKGASTSIMYDLDGDQLADIDRRLAALPAAYQLLLTAADRSRLAKLKETRKGNSQDMEFIAATLPSQVTVFEKDAARIRAVTTEAEVAVKEALQKKAVVIRLKSGGRLEGYILKETDSQVTFNTITGITMPIKKADITQIEAGSAPQLQFEGKLKEARGNATKLHTLMAWCRQNKLPPFAKYVAGLLLQVDPNNAAARAEAGVPAVGSR